MMALGSSMMMEGIGSSSITAAAAAAQEDECVQLTENITQIWHPPLKKSVSHQQSLLKLRSTLEKIGDSLPHMNGMKEELLRSRFHPGEQPIIGSPLAETMAKMHIELHSPELPPVQGFPASDGAYDTSRNTLVLSSKLLRNKTLAKKSKVWLYSTYK
jgi:hypothetical protein